MQFKIFIFSKFLIYFILSIFYQSIKVFFSSALDYISFHNKFKKDLIKVKKIWKKNLDYNSNNSYMVTEVFDDSSLYAYTLLTHAKKIERIKKIPIIVFDKNFSFIKNKFYQVFEVRNIIHINAFFFSFFIILKKLPLLFKEFCKIEKIQSCQDLGYKFEDIELSNIAYDDHLRFKIKGTVKNLNELKFFIFKSLLMSIKIKYVFDQKKIKYFAGGENQFTPRANLTQYFLKKECICYMRVGRVNLSSVRKYKKFSQRSIPRNYINKRFYLYSLSKKNNFLNKSKEILDKKFQSIFHKNENLIDAKYVFSKNQKKPSKVELYKKLNFDEKKKLIVVFSHNVYDGVFVIRRKLFIDNYVWLKETLNLLSYNNNINVLVKKHPTEFLIEKIKDISLNILDEIPEQNKLNIRFYPEDLSPNFIKENADCIVTGHGSAGIEYACYGIPSVSCNNSPYSYCGTTNQAQTLKEYKNLIENIHNLKRLDNDQIEKSLVLFYLTHSLDKNKNEFFDEMPDFHPSELVGFQKNFEYRFFKKIFQKLINIENVEETDIYKKYLNFLESNDYGMYDIRKLK